MDLSRRVLLRRLGATGLAASIAGCSSDGESTATTTPAGTDTAVTDGTTTETASQPPATTDGATTETTTDTVTADAGTPTTTDAETTTGMPDETTVRTETTTTTTARTTTAPPTKTDRTAQEEYPDYDWDELSDASATETTSITAASRAFDPLVVSVSPGTTVTWTNEDDFRHNISMPKLDVDQNFPGGGSTSVTFAETGTYDYVCVFHPTGMLGRVVVE
jgi:plastocyanin